MQFLVASDSFKDALTAYKACVAIEKGIRHVYPHAEVIKKPMADGGEGTLDVIATFENTESLVVHTVDPLGRPIRATYFILNQKEAFIELARASGLELLLASERNPLLTSTFGTGKLMSDAFEKGIRKFTLAIGGSATNDMGSGLLQAIGFRFFDKKHQELSPNGGNLNRIVRIDDSAVHPDWYLCEFNIACDVNNPLLGENGATHTYGKQKGASPSALKKLERNLAHFAEVLQTINSKLDVQQPGFGAAGGVAVGLSTFFKVQLQSGFACLANWVDLESAIRKADYVFTGEGSIDAQTLAGKTPFGVAQMAKKHNKPVICLCGRKGKGYQKLYNHGVTAVFSILDEVTSLDKALLRTEELIEDTTINVLRLLTLNTFR
ncbi:MAG: glycerate kinase [Bacteroidetes bacterium]|nr:glycerate kinase [Bacteroidota bacterium]